ELAHTHAHSWPDRGKDVAVSAPRQSIPRAPKDCYKPKSATHRTWSAHVPGISAAHIRSASHSPRRYQTGDVPTQAANAIPQNTGLCERRLRELQSLRRIDAGSKR